MKRSIGKSFAGSGWIAAGLVLIMLIRAIPRPAADQDAAAPKATGTGTDLRTTPVIPPEAADFLDRHAPGSDFIQPSALQAIREHPSVFLVDIRTPREGRADAYPAPY